MRISLAASVVVLGTVVLGAGCVAMYNHAILADETRISGWNPALWLVILSGTAVVIVGTVQVLQSASHRPAASRTPSAES
jgi:hypothetical protein